MVQNFNKDKKNKDIKIKSSLFKQNVSDIFHLLITVDIKTVSQLQINEIYFPTFILMLIYPFFYLSFRSFIMKLAQ